MQTDEGGLRANTRIPIADLLSTFTGLLTLQDLGGAAEIDFDQVRRFVTSLELEDGGFHGAQWDPAHDVEYTFYGLGTLGLLVGRGND
jgi:geranylgeranyl transferase type-2 subunit beta